MISYSAIFHGSYPASVDFTTNKSRKILRRTTHAEKKKMINGRCIKGDILLYRDRARIRLIIKIYHQRIIHMTSYESNKARMHCFARFYTCFGWEAESGHHGGRPNSVSLAFCFFLFFSLLLLCIVVQKREFHKKEQVSEKWKNENWWKMSKM